MSERYSFAKAAKIALMAFSNLVRESMCGAIGLCSGQKVDKLESSRLRLEIGLVFAKPRY